MASPAEVGQNIPETLPADFGEWDASESPSAVPAEAPTNDSREVAPKETPQREFARREAEAIDIAKRPYTSREVSREYEPARNVTPFPERDEVSLTPRGIPAPAVRAPRTSPAPAAVATPEVQDDTTFLRRMKSLDTVVDKLPATESRIEAIKGSNVLLAESKPDKPLFSSIAAAEAEADDLENGPTLLNELVEDEEERKTRRKWITSACIFGGSLLLVTIQLFHYYGSSAKLKHIVAVQPTQSATALQEPETDPATITDSRTPADKPSPSVSTTDAESLQAEGNSGKQQATGPAAQQKQMMQSQLMAPSRLPQNVKSGAPSDTPPPASLGGASIDALNGNTSVGNVFSGRSSEQVSGPRVVTVSAGVAVGMLTHKTQPVYPAIARSARVQGTVVLNATISSSGKVTNIKIVSGPPMLRQAAVDAVKTWQYKPYTLNNQPTDVETTVNVQFSLGG